MTRRPDSPLALPPRGLSRAEAARYVGIGIEAFDKLVEAGLFPRAKSVGRRLVWDRFAIDVAFEELPEAAPPTQHNPADGDEWTPRV